jgi:hypothetical protein
VSGRYMNLRAIWRFVTLFTLLYMCVYVCVTVVLCLPLVWCGRSMGGTWGGRGCSRRAYRCDTILISMNMCVYIYIIYVYIYMYIIIIIQSTHKAHTPLLYATHSKG